MNVDVECLLSELCLEQRELPVNVGTLARECGIRAVESKPLNIDGMLIPSHGGYSIVINEEQPIARQRFTCAHELAHFLIAKKLGTNGALPKFRDKTWGDQCGDPLEERICNRLAAEVLMPREAFKQAGDDFGWTLDSIPRLARLFATSVSATALRLIELNPEPTLLTSWRLQPGKNPMQIKLVWNKQSQLCWPEKYGVQRSTERAYLLPIYRAFRHNELEYGFTRVFVQNGKDSLRKDVPTQSLSFGAQGNQFVMGMHFVSRPLTEENMALKRILDPAYGPRQ